MVSSRQSSAMTRIGVKRKPCESNWDDTLTLASLANVGWWEVWREVDTGVVGARRVCPGALVPITSWADWNLVCPPSPLGVPPWVYHHPRGVPSITSLVPSITSWSTSITSMGVPPSPLGVPPWVYLHPRGVPSITSWADWNLEQQRLVLRVGQWNCFGCIVFSRTSLLAIMEWIQYGHL